MTAQRALTMEEFMAWEAAQERKHEYLREQVFPYNPEGVAMPGAARWYREIELNLVVVGTLFADSPSSPTPRTSWS